MDGETKDFGATTVLLEFLRKISPGHNLDIEAGFNGEVIGTIAKSGFSPALHENTIEPWTAFATILCETGFVVFRFFMTLLVLLIVPIASAMACRAAPLDDLRLEIHPAASRSDTFVVLLSGDGGWQAIDQALTHRFNQAGIGVIGLNSRTYFFERKSPRILARDLERIIAVYSTAWKARRIGLVGYSFGADALPFAWPYLSPAIKRATRSIALLGLVPTANFRISIWEMLDMPAADDVPVAPALRRLPMHKVVCIYGAGERADGETACIAPELRAATRIERAGGHRFDADYGGVGDILVRRLLPLPSPIRK
jgi:type IV secretory pathway VirJ component